jgi:hypothetical protein
VVALALAWAVGDEPFSVKTVVAATIVLGAVALIWRSSAVPGHSESIRFAQDRLRKESDDRPLELRTPNARPADISRSWP